MSEIEVMKPDRVNVIEGVCRSAAFDAMGDLSSHLPLESVLPVQLLHTHDPHHQVGEVLHIWKAHDCTRFRARIDDDEAWSEIVQGRLHGVSLKCGDPAGPYTRRLEEVSVCAEGVDPGARIEIFGTIARSRLADPSAEIRAFPAKSYHVPRVFCEEPVPMPAPIHQNRLKQIESSVDDCRKIMLRDGVSYAEHTAAKSALEKLNAEHRRLLEVGMLAKAGIAPEPAKHQYADEVATEWDIEEIAEPREPDDWRDPELRLAYLRQLISFHTAAVAKSARDAGFSPRAFSSASDVVSLKGEISAYGFFQRGKFAALEKRLEEIENNATVFLGVHQRAISYKRGSLVSSAGGLWCAVSPAAQGQIPGKADCWQLAVKKGTFDD